MPLRPNTAIREAARNAAAHRGMSVVVLLVTAAITAVTFLTAGRAAAAEDEILRSVDEAGPRLITVTVEEPAPGLDDAALDRLATIAGTNWVLGLGPARDVRSGVLGRNATVAAREVLTGLPAEVTVDRGRAPKAGEAILGVEPQRILQLLEPSGTVIDGGLSRPLVGRFGSSGAIADLDRLVLVQPDDSAPRRATLVYVLAVEADQVSLITDQILALSGLDPEVVNVQTSAALVDLDRVLSGQMGALSRQIALGAIGAGIVLISLTMALALNSRRRDYGRRRALGASRSALVALSIVEAVIPIVIGVVAGTALGLAVILLWLDVVPPPTFVLATIALIGTTGIAAAVPPAALAAWRDPVEILRVP